MEETLRYDTSTQFLVRTATEDIALHGGVVPGRGARSCCCSGRPTVTRGPSTIPTGTTSTATQDTQLASFGVGRHFCLGASLARLEARVTLEELVARVADYDIDEAGAERVHSANVRGFARLPTSVTRR